MSSSALAQRLCDDERALLERLSTKRRGCRAPRVSCGHVITLGDPGVGKSSLLRRYAEDRFSQRYAQTVGVDYGAKTVADRGGFVLHYFDLSGHPDFLDVRVEFFQYADLVMLVFDVQSRRSFEALGTWVEEFTEYRERGRQGEVDKETAQPAFVVVGNKREVGSRAVGETEARKWAASRQYSYFDVSSATGENVAALFDHAVSALDGKPPPPPTAEAHNARMEGGSRTLDDKTRRTLMEFMNRKEYEPKLMDLVQCHSSDVPTSAAVRDVTQTGMTLAGTCISWGCDGGVQTATGATEPREWIVEFSRPAETLAECNAVIKELMQAAAAQKEDELREMSVVVDQHRDYKPAKKQK